MSRTGTFSPVDQANPYGIPPQYSREPPRLRPEYVPSARRQIGGDYYSPTVPGPPYTAIDRRGRDFDDSYSDSYGRTPPRRPNTVTRRSSSYHGPDFRDRDRRYDSSSAHDGQALVVRTRRNSASHGESMREKAHHYGLKEKIENSFTTTPIGITGGAVGAVLGGWAARKAQTAADGEKHGKVSGTAVTLLGAAVGGLAVNFIVDKWEDNKKKTEKAEDKWEDKFGPPSEGESDGGRNHRRSRRDRHDSGDRGDRDDYKGERGGRGYAPYS